MLSINDIQQIAQGVVDCSDCCDGQLFTGKVTGKNPLKIMLGIESGSSEIDGDDIILTQSVVAKKIHIKSVILLIFVYFYIIIKDIKQKKEE